MVSQKMQASASKQGFTLVELIVVITILAILGTIGFISIQGYSAQSRDSKRTSDLRSLASAITIKATDGMTLTSFVTPVPERAMSGTSVAAGTHVAGKVLTPYDNDYSAGSPNFTALGVSPTNFVDGSNQYAIGTTGRVGGAFQLAATLEAGGTKAALTTGNYSSRAGTEFTGTFLGTTGSGFTVNALSGSGVGFFMKGDVITAGGIIATINTVNGDGTGFSATSDTTVPANGSDTASLKGGFAEASGLMASKDSNTEAVANGSTTALPY